MGVMPEQRYAVTFKADPGKVAIFEGDSTTVYAWCDGRHHPEAWLIYVHSTATYIEVHEFMEIHRPEPKPGAQKVADVAGLVLKALLKQDVATYNGEGSQGMDQLAIDTAKKILKII